MKKNSELERAPVRDTFILLIINRQIKTHRDDFKLFSGEANHRALHVDVSSQ